MARLTLPDGGALGRMKSGRWYAPPSGTTTGSPLNNDISYSPLFVANAVTLDRIAVEVTVAGQAGSVVRLGIYNDDAGTGYPGTLLLNAGTVPGDGATGIKEITISQPLTPGLYWLAALCTDAATTRPTLRRSNQPLAGVSASSSSDAMNGFLEGVGVIGHTSLPAVAAASMSAAAQSVRTVVRAA